MGDIEKSKTHLVNEVLPETWFIKFLRPARRKPHRRLIDHAHSSEPLPRGKKVVENIYKYRASTFNRIEALPSFTAATTMKELASNVSPRPEESLLRAFSKSKSYVHPDEADDADEVSSRITNASHGRRKSFSVFSSAAFSLLRKMCRNEASLAHGERSFRSEEANSRRASAIESSRRRWFLLGCVSFSSRSRRTGHGSIRHLKKASLLQSKFANAEPEAVTLALTAEGAPSEIYSKCDSWLDASKAWSTDLSTCSEVVKCLVDDAKSSPPVTQKPASLRAFFPEHETDDTPMICPHSGLEEFQEEFDSVPPWTSMSSSGSAREFWKAERKMRSIECEDALVPYSGEFDSVDIGNISDSQSLLRAKVFGVEMFRKQSRLDNRREEEMKKLLFSLDHALDQYNYKRIAEDDPVKCESPNYELFNSPVFERFLEPPTETDFLQRDSKAAESIRELHCVTVQSPGLAMSSFEEDLASNSYRSVAAKGRKAFKQSPTCEDRIHHPQREENLALNFARLQIDELSSRKKQFSKPQQRGKGSSPLNRAESSVSPRPPLPAGNVIKESVAVVVESSYDPYGDFRESMIDMIVDQNIQQTADLEELLQCYLALNEPEYHEVIIEVFSGVWHELFEKKA